MPKETDSRAGDMPTQGDIDALILEMEAGPRWDHGEVTRNRERHALFLTSRRARHRLERLGLAAVPSLIKALARDVHGRASRALGQIAKKVPESHQVIVRDGVTHPDRLVRQRAATVLGGLGVSGVEAVPQLGRLLHDADKSVSAAAIQALGRIAKHVPEARPIIVRDGLTHANASIRRHAATLLGELGASGVEAAELCRLLHDANESVSEAAAKALDSIGSAAEASAATSSLVDLLSDSRSKYRGFAARQLARIGRAARCAIPTLVQTMKEDPEPRVRRQAFAALTAVDPEWRSASRLIGAVVRGAGPDYDRRRLLPNVAGTLQSRIRMNRKCIRALLRQGYVVNVLEMLSVKSDAGGGARAALCAARAGMDIPWAIPETTHRLQMVLRCVGLESQFETAVNLRDLLDGGEVRSPVMTVRWLHGSDLRQCPDVRSPEGLFSEPTPRDGTQESTRRRQFARIDLSAEVLHPWHLNSPESVLQLIPGVSKENVLAIVSGDAWVVTRAGHGLSAGEILTREQMLHAGDRLPEGGFSAQTGPEAVRWLLAATEWSRELEHYKEARSDTIALASKDGRVRLKTLQRMTDSPHAFTIPSLSAVAVLPLEVRGQPDSPLNSAYRSVIWMATNLRRHLDQGFPEQSISQDKRRLQEDIDTLFSRFNEMLREVLADMTDKPVELAARSWVHTDPELKPGTVGLPRPAAEELLGGLSQQRPLLAVADDGRAVGLQPVLCDGLHVRLHPTDRLQLGLGGDDEITLHLPLSAEAVDEVSRSPLRPSLEGGARLLEMSPETLMAWAIDGRPVPLSLTDRVLLGVEQPAVFDDL